MEMYKAISFIKLFFTFNYINEVTNINITDLILTKCHLWTWT